MFIPTIGTRLTVNQPWTFDLYPEYRNHNLRHAVGIINDGASKWVRSNDQKEESVTLPTGTVLVVDRVYVRKGMSNFDSVTFNIPKKDNPELFANFPNKPSGQVRFWVKLADLDGLDFRLER